MQGQVEGVNYRKKYKTLKRKLRMLIYEQECFAEELRKAQRKLLRISRDKSFLLDRLLQYEDVDASATDTDVTESSGSEDEQAPPAKRKKSNASTPQFGAFPVSSHFASSTPNVQTSGIQQLLQQKKTPKAAKKPKPASKKAQGLQGAQQQQKSPSKQKGNKGAKNAHTPMAWTREDLEAHLERASSAKQEFLSSPPTASLPENIFTDNSNSCDFPDSKTTDDEDLVIDMP